MTGSDTASRARSFATDLGEKPIAATTGIPVGDLVGPLVTVSVLPPKEELPTYFEVRARILDFYPITLDEENCLLRVCGDCKNLSVPCVTFLHQFMLKVSLKDRENCRVMPRLFEPDASSACSIPLFASFDAGHGKRRRTRGNSRKHRCKPYFDDRPLLRDPDPHSNRMGSSVE